MKRLNCSVAGLRRLKHPTGRLTGTDERACLALCILNVADGDGACFQRMLVGIKRLLPALARPIDELRAGLVGCEVFVSRLELLIDVLDVIGEPLGLPHEACHLREIALDLREHGGRQVRQIPGLIDEHLRLVGQ